MPLSSGCSISAFRNNIAKMMREGRPRAQAVAAAFSTLKAGCKKAGKPIPDMGEELSADDLLIVLEEEMADPDNRDTSVWGIFDYKPE